MRTNWSLSVGARHTFHVIGRVMMFILFFTIDVNTPSVFENT